MLLQDRLHGQDFIHPLTPGILHPPQVGRGVGGAQGGCGHDLARIEHRGQRYFKAVFLQTMGRLQARGRHRNLDQDPYARVLQQGDFPAPFQHFVRRFSPGLKVDFLRPERCGFLRQRCQHLEPAVQVCSCQQQRVRGYAVNDAQGQKARPVIDHRRIQKQAQGTGPGGGKRCVVSHRRHPHGGQGSGPPRRQTSRAGRHGPPSREQDIPVRRNRDRRRGDPPDG